MLFCLITLAIALCALYINHKLPDEIFRLIFKLTGLLSLFLGLVSAHWFITLLLVVGILVMPVCAQQHRLQRLYCSPVCIARSTCPYLSI